LRSYDALTIPSGRTLLPARHGKEKMEPWDGALMDNLEVERQPGGATGPAATNEPAAQPDKIRSLNFMRGGLSQSFIILNEAQNLTPKQMKR